MRTNYIGSVIKTEYQCLLCNGFLYKEVKPIDDYYTCFSCYKYRLIAYNGNILSDYFFIENFAIKRWSIVDNEPSETRIEEYKYSLSFDIEKRSFSSNIFKKIIFLKIAINSNITIEKIKSLMVLS